MKTFELLYPMESILPRNVKDLSGGDGHWCRGHIYEVPDNFDINEDYIKIIKKGGDKWELKAPDKR